MKKRVVVLGSTGSIGRQALELIREFRARFEIVGLSAGKNYGLILEQADEFGVRRVCICDPEAYNRASIIAKQKGIDLLFGESGIIELVSGEDVDIVINAIVGADGLLATIKALESGKRLCLANKESLVSAGRFVMEIAKTRGELIPIDSEHSAIFQAMKSGKVGEVKRIILTASGGPLWHKEETENLSVDEALAHPTWSMGKKITVDSATMMNKGFEIIEAHWLFGLPFDKIDVLIHPESVVHSIVEFVDNSMISQMSTPDMRIPIQYALFYPDRVSSSLTNPLELQDIKHLTFFEPPSNKYPGLALAREIAQKGGNLPAALVVADDVVVDAFLKKKVPFNNIIPLIREIVDRIEYIENPSLSVIFRTMELTKELAREIVETYGGGDARMPSL